MRILFCIGLYKGALFELKSERKSTKNTHPCVEADIAEYTHFTFRE